MRSTAGELRQDVVIGILSLAVLLAAFGVLGIGYDGDAQSYLLWGRELVSGTHLNRCNPAFTTPKILPILLAAVGQWVPGESGAEWLYAIVTAVLGAGVVALTARLARRLGGPMAGWLAVPLVLCHIQFIQYTINGQSAIQVSFFLLGALLLATREEATPRDYLWAGVLVLVSGLIRPEAAVLGGALALGVWLRLGWRRLGWPIAVGLIGLAAAPITLLFNRIAFGSFRYNVDLVLNEMSYRQKVLPSLFKGFASDVVMVIYHYANRLPLLLLLACVGLGLMAGPRAWRRYAAVVLFPLATTASVWLTLAGGYLFNQRCFFYVTFLIVALAAAGVARLAAWAAASGEFLGLVSVRGRTLAFALAALLAMAPTYLTRPLPRDGKQFASVRRAADVLQAQLEGEKGPVRLLVSDEAAYVFYRLRLNPDESCVPAIRLLHGGGDGKLPADVNWYLVNKADTRWELPPRWPLKLFWQDPGYREMGAALYRRVAEKGPEAGGTRPEGAAVEGGGRRVERDP